MQTETTPPPPPPLRSRLFHSPGGRLLLIGLLLLALMIPAQMIRGVVLEREGRRDEAAAGIVGSWGGGQHLLGPVLRVPFQSRQRSTDKDGKVTETRYQDAAYLLPQSLKIDARLDTQLLRRGMFELPVYSVHLKLGGHFAQPDLARWGVLAEDIDWQGAELIVSLSEPRALQADASLDWQGRKLRFRPSTGSGRIGKLAGIHAPLGQPGSELFTDGRAAFAIELAAKGAEQLSFAPAAEETTVSLSSAWPHPSFQGDWLPVRREVGSQGFSADWSVSYLGRDYPQSWRESAPVGEALEHSRFGVSLAVPVDPYMLAERISKYALLTLVCTFAVIWLTELLSGRRVHPIQYGFVGAALCLFGLLQLSVAEHFGFTTAFIVAAVAVTLLVTLYSRSLLGGWRSLAVGSVLGGLYAYLYTILQAEDYALLGGAVALFLGLAVAMYLTRDFNWFGGGEAPPAA
ncbi:cell envelope integrity protein CreD [Solimonas sp. K1W22B-7]|uniref:cell envelope integrity protein CreD n=1 Tax=Solimonas sp. K1W22B-7 TaxID=2303331 RepID=UPI000E333F62|nr:cell envelope integrity protein CreD [Solimonas sp. K1W22B-7]AXQ28629.1 cell envelope integrity protein CreD [Solimonas sp. K1W22B-7]